MLKNLLGGKEIKQRGEFMKKNYEHNIHKNIVINAGMGFQALWKVVSVFLPK